MLSLGNQFDMHLKMQYSEQVEDWYSGEDSPLFKSRNSSFYDQNPTLPGYYRRYRKW